MYLRALWEQILVFLIAGALHCQGGTERSKSPCRCQSDLCTHPPSCPEILIFPGVCWTLPDGYFYVLGCCQGEPSPHELSTESPSYGQGLWPPHLFGDGVTRMRLHAARGPTSTRCFSSLLFHQALTKPSCHPLGAVCLTLLRG